MHAREGWMLHVIERLDACQHRRLELGRLSEFGLELQHLERSARRGIEDQLPVADAIREPRRVGQGAMRCCRCAHVSTSDTRFKGVSGCRFRASPAVKKEITIRSGCGPGTSALAGAITNR